MNKPWSAIASGAYSLGSFSVVFGVLMCALSPGGNETSFGVFLTEGEALILGDMMVILGMICCFLGYISNQVERMICSIIPPSNEPKETHGTNDSQP